MVQELLGSAMTQAAAIITAASLFMYYWRKGDAEKMQQLRADVTELRKDMDEQNTRHESEVASMEARATFRDTVIAQLQEHLIQARIYIATLRGILADRGIPTPEPEADFTMPTQGA